MLPNFILAGPPKCASTSLHHYLDQHPDIYMSSVKETNFFTRDYERGLEFYSQYFTGAEDAKAIGEATPLYSALPFVAERIKLNFPRMKFIFCFRNPVDRIFSHWLMHNGAGTEKLGLREAIEMNQVQMQRYNLEGIEGAKMWTNNLGDYSAGETRIRTFLQASLYARILKTYQSHFGAGQVKAIFLDDLKNNFDKTLQEIFRFLEVEPLFAIPDKRPVNNYVDRKTSRMLNRFIGINATRSLKKIMPATLKNNFKKLAQAGNTPVLSIDDRKFLWEFVKNDVNELEVITHRNLSDWKLDMTS